MPSPTKSAAAIPFAPTTAQLEAAIALLDELGPASGSAVAAEQRRAAFARYEALTLPGPRPGRSWRHDYTKLRFDELQWSSLRLPIDAAPTGASAGGLVHSGSTLLEPRHAPALPRGLQVLSLAEARREADPAVCPTPFRVLQDAVAQDKFAALSAAFQNCGAWVYVPPNVVHDEPIQLVFAGSEAVDAAVFPHILVILGEGARATVIERHVGEGRPFVCGVAAVHLGDRAQLDYVTVQHAPEEARLFMTRTGECGREAELRWHVAEIGATLSRSVVHTRLDHAGANAQTSALFFNTGFQHVDLTTTVDHVVGDTQSTTVVRSAAADRGQGRYFGNIVIAPHAQGSDASLRDDSLLLSKRAHIDSVPALEIGANGVRAFHGATVGSLDREQLFYASSRGIAKADAVRMIALAFFEPAITRFPGEALREEVRILLDDRIDAATEIDA